MASTPQYQPKSYSPGDRPSASDLNRNAAETNRLARISGSGVNVVSSGDGISLSVPEGLELIFGLVTGHGTTDANGQTPHSWKERRDDKDGFEDKTNGLTGDSEVDPMLNPAYEVNDAIVADDTEIILWRSGSYIHGSGTQIIQKWRFQVGGKGGGCLVKARAVGTIPAFGACMPSSVGADGIMQVKTPDVDGAETVFFCGEANIPAGEVGDINVCLPAYALYATADGTPAAKQIWGTKSGSDRLHKAYPGFVIIGQSTDDAADGKVLVTGVQQERSKPVRLASITANADGFFDAWVVRYDPVANAYIDVEQIWVKP